MSCKIERCQDLKMISYITAIILFCLLSVIGCSSKDITEYKYNYKGENTNWTAEYKGYSAIEFYKEKGVLKSKQKADGNLLIAYKGDLSELSSAVEIGYEFINGGAKSTFFDRPDNRSFSWNHSITGAIKETEDMKIIIDGKTELIKMKRVK